MGCWNKTCIISNLPIRCSEPVIGVFLASMKNNGEPYEYHVPLPFYIEGEYDDYGRIENEKGIALPILMEAFKKKLDKVDQGDNKYHDTPVDPDNLTFHGIMEADHNSRLHFTHRNVLSHEQEVIKLQHAQIRLDVFDQIIEKFKPEIRKQGEPYSSRGKSYSEIMEDYDAFYQLLADEAEEGKLRGFSLRSAFESYENYVAVMLKQDYDKTNGVLDLSQQVRNIFDNGTTKEELRPFIENAVKLEMISRFIRATHRQWTMPGYAGQEGCTEAHTLFANIVIEVSEDMEGFYDE